MGDLDELMADLPGIDLYRLPHASMQRYRGPVAGGTSPLSALHSSGVATGHGRFSPAWRAAWGSWFSVSLLSFVIWAATGAGYIWPLWVAGPLGAVLICRWISGDHPRGSGGHPQGG